MTAYKVTDLFFSLKKKKQKTSVFNVLTGENTMGSEYSLNFFHESYGSY